MHPLLKSLNDLSVAANEALTLLEENDYRKESYSEEEDYLDFELLPKTLRQVINSLIKYCVPVPTIEDNIDNCALINKRNIEIFNENFTDKDSKTQSHYIQFIHLEPIQYVAEHFNELGLVKQARLLENAVEFGRGLRTSGYANSFSSSQDRNTPVQINLTVPIEELNEDEKADAMRYSDFCSIFRQGAFSTSQKKALYKEFKAELSEPKQNRPHLVITAAIVLLMTRAYFKKPLIGTFNKIRSTVFSSLGLPENTAKSYGLKSLKADASLSLAPYKKPAEDLLARALGNTR